MQFGGKLVLIDNLRKLVILHEILLTRFGRFFCYCCSSSQRKIVSLYNFFPANHCWQQNPLSITRLLRISTRKILLALNMMSFLETQTVLYKHKNMFIFPNSKIAFEIMDF